MNIPEQVLLTSVVAFLYFSTLVVAAYDGRLPNYLLKVPAAFVAALAVAAFGLYTGFAGYLIYLIWGL